jgi:hypothetical protein
VSEEPVFFRPEGAKKLKGRANNQPERPLDERATRELPLKGRSGLSPRSSRGKPWFPPMTPRHFVVGCYPLPRREKIVPKGDDPPLKIPLVLSGSPKIRRPSKKLAGPIFGSPSWSMLITSFKYFLRCSPLYTKE